MGALPGTAGLHSMKTKYLAASLLARFQLWASASVWNQLWVSTSLPVLGKVLGETWQAGFVGICLTTAHSVTHGGAPGHRRFTLNENNIFVSFAFGSVSALGVHFGLESALGVHSVGGSWGGLGRIMASRACRHLLDYRPLGTTWGPSWAPPLHTQ